MSKELMQVFKFQDSEVRTTHCDHCDGNQRVCKPEVEA